MARKCYLCNEFDLGLFRISSNEICNRCIARVAIAQIRQLLFESNYPNPFNPSTVVSFIVYKRGFATIKIFNLFGQEVQTLLADNIDAGYHEIHWTPVSLSSGIYFYQLNIHGHAQTKKLIFLK